MLARGAEEGFHRYFYGKDYKKFENPEKSLFDDCTKRLGNLEYVKVSLI